MSNAAFQNPTPPPAAGEGAGPFAFPDHLGGPVNPVEEQAAPSFGGTPLPGEALPASHDPDVALELALLRQIYQAQLGTGAHLVVSENAPQAITEVDYPIPGVKRWLIPRVPTGGEFVLPESGEWVPICPTNHGRIGGSLVNRGAGGVILALAHSIAVTPVSGREYLAPKGGAWDFLLAHVIWGGPVCAKAVNGEGILELAEL